MAHFAKIGLNSKVIEVLTVNNNVLLDADGNESEKNGIDFLTKLTGWSIWKQTSYNRNFRKHFAGIGMTYDENRDAFISDKPFNSWILNEETCIWEAPISKPELTQEQINNRNYYSWNETNQQWDLNE